MGGSGAFRTYLVLTPRNGDVEALASGFLAERVLEEALPSGMVRGELLDAADRDALVVAALWPSSAAYDHWLAAPARAHILETLGPLLDPENGVRSWTREDPHADLASLASVPLDLGDAIPGARRAPRHVVTAPAA